MKCVSKLLIASWKGHNDAVELLSNKGADITLVDHEDGKTAFIRRASENYNRRYNKIVKLLLENKGADDNIDITDEERDSALTRAIEKGHTEIVKLLLDMGADFRIADGVGMTALMIATEKENNDIVKLLLEKVAADPNFADKHGRTALMRATEEGHNDIVKRLVEMDDADINIADKDGHTALMRATEKGHNDIVKLLLEKVAADPNIADKHGRTALMRATEKGHNDIVKSLVEMGADINVVDTYGNTALTHAIEKGHTEIVKLLLDMGANFRIADGVGRTALLNAFQLGLTKMMELLLDKSEDLNVANKDDGNTALINASIGGHAKIVEMLLDKGADFRITNNDGDTALTLALKREHSHIVGLLVEKGADINITDYERDTRFVKALAEGQDAIFGLLVDKGADINIGDKERDTMLMKALQKGNTKIVKFLLDKGADINFTDHFGSTALMIAFKGGHTVLVKLLVEKGADINIANKSGDTPLMLASQWGQTKMLEIMLEKGAVDPKIADKNGKTLLMHASNEGHNDTVELLLEKGADIKSVDNDGLTTLMCAFKRGHTNTVKLLLDKGAHINIAEKEGWAVLMYAFEKGHTELVKILLDKSEDINIAYKDDGNTLLIKACIEERTKIVEMLLEKGLDCKITNSQGRTAFTEAYYRRKTKIVELLLQKAPLQDIIHDIVQFPHFADKFLELYKENRDIVHWPDGQGRTVRQMACKECREAILFMGQFDMDDQPVYESPTCKIYNALDYGDPDEPKLEQPRPVAVKFMKEVEHFLNEMQTRRNDDGTPRFSSEFVTPDFASYRADQDPEYAKECKAYLLPKFCLVMPRAERSLLEAMNSEYLSAKHKDLQRREILLTLCKIFSYLHGMGYVHGDIKPHNVVRHLDGNVTWKAIDFDACTKIGDVVGLKLTTGLAPPEMLKVVQNNDGGEINTESMVESKIIFRQPGGSLDKLDLVLADPSFDVWSFGMLMYQLVTGGSFFHCDLQGNLVDAGLQELANLTEGRINEKLASVEDVNARVLLSRIFRLDPEERPTMSAIAKDYYFHPSESPQGRKAEFFGKQVFSIFVPQVLDSEMPSAAFEASQISSAEKDDNNDSQDMEDLETFISSKAEFSYFKLRDEDKDWSDKLLNSEVETFRFDELDGMGQKPKCIDGDTIYNSSFLRSLLSRKGPDYFMGFLVEYFELYKIMNDAHAVCQGIKANLVSDVKSLKGIFIKLFVRGKGLNDIVRGTLFCNSVDQFRYVGRQLKEQYGHNVYIKPPKKEAGAWPIPKLLVYGNRRFHGRCMSVEIQFSTVYMHLATHASNNHLVYEAIRESTGYLGDKDKDFHEFLQLLNHQYIDTEGFLQNQSGQEGRFEILVEHHSDETDRGKTHRHEESDQKYITKATGFILGGRVRCGNQLFRFMSPTDRFQRFSESSFVVNGNLTLLSSHSYWSDESYDLEGKSVEFLVSFKGRGLVIAGIGTSKCLHGSKESSNGGGVRCSVHVSRSKFVVRKSGVEEVFREKKLPDQERAMISFKMKDGVLSVSFVGTENDQGIESVQVSMPSDQRYYLYMRAPPGVHDVKFHDINIL